MSEQSDRLITEVAKKEHQQRKEAVIRAAKAWRYAEGKRLAHQALDDAVYALITFEENHKDRLNG